MYAINILNFINILIYIINIYNSNSGIANASISERARPQGEDFFMTSPPLSVLSNSLKF